MNKDMLVSRIRMIVDWVLNNTDTLSQEEIAETIGAHRTSLSSALGGNERYATRGLLAKFKNAYPECPYVDMPIPSEKLSYLTEIKEKDHKLSDIKTKHHNHSKTYTVPLLPISAQAGTLNDFVASVKESDCEMVTSPIKGVDLVIPISGDSMAPDYPNGAEAFVVKINSESFIEWGRVHALDTCNGTIIKVLSPGSSEDCLMCTSLNPDPVYAPFEVCKQDIYGIYRILGVFSRK